MADRDLTLSASGPSIGGFARRTGLAGFWRWWSRELASLVPGAARTAMARRRMRPMLLFEGDRATLWLSATVEGRPVMQERSTISLAGDAASVAAAGRTALALYSGPARAGVAGVPRVVVALAPRDVLRKTLRLPAAVAENLAQAMAYDLDRHTPFKPDELYFDAAIAAHDTAKNEIEVDLASARRSVVDAARKHVQSWGAEVVAVVPDMPANAAMSRLNLLPREARSERPFWSTWEFWVPLAMVVLLALTAVAIPLWQKREFAIALADVAESARRQAAVSEALRQDLDTRVSDYNFVLGRKYAFPPPGTQIDEATRLLPDDTWLTQLDLKTTTKGKDVARELLIRGETANAGRLVPIFEESKLFMQAAPRSPTTKIQPGPGEIFDLGAQVRPLPAPAQISLLAGDATTKGVGDGPKAEATPAGPAPAPPVPVTPTPTKSPPVPPQPAAPAPATSSSVPQGPVAAPPSSVPQMPVAAPPLSPTGAPPSTPGRAAPPPPSSGAKP